MKYEAWLQAYHRNILSKRIIAVGLPDTISTRTMEKDLKEAFEAGRRTVIEELLEVEKKANNAKAYDKRVRKQMRDEIKELKDLLAKS